MTDKVTAAAVLLGLAWTAWIASQVWEAFTVRGRLSRRYWRALRLHGKDSDEARAAEADLIAHWREIDRL